MITPRRTRLVRVADLHAFRRAVSALIPDAPRRNSTLVVVPTRGAVAAIDATWPRQHAASPSQSARFVTRDGLYDALHRGLAAPPRRLNPVEREAIAQAAAYAAAKAVGDLPFRIRPGLVRELLRFYDTLGRQSQPIERFETLIVEALGGEEHDRGDTRLLKQTRFLAAAFREYEARVAASGGCDERLLRARLIESAAPLRVEHVVVTTADWIADPAGLFAADFDLMTRAPGIERLDLVCTKAVLASGFHERIHTWWPGLEEVDGAELIGSSESTRPLLIRPPVDAAPDDLWFTHRDRHDELAVVGGRLSGSDAAALDRAAVVYKRPLPYLYLAPDTLGARGLPYRVNDALPLAAEPALATLDLVLDLVETDWSRDALVALLRSPHLSFEARERGNEAQQAGRSFAVDAIQQGALPFDLAEVAVDVAEVAASRTPWRESVAAMNRVLSDARFLGGRDRLAAIAASHDRPAAADAFIVALEVVARLAPLRESRPASQQIDGVRQFLAARFTALDDSDPLAERDRRSRARLLELLQELADAHRTYHDPVWTLADLTTALRRWIGDETFDVTAGERGIFLLDDQSARYGIFDDVTIVGIIEHEWPEKPRRNIFYSAAVLKALGWPSERDRRAAADARFLDLLGSPSARVELSTFTLDDETLVGRSVQLDEVVNAQLSTDVRPLTEAEREVAASSWDDLRELRLPADDPALHGEVGARDPRPWSVSALETYIGCPFRFYAQHVLKLEEEPEDEEIMDPRRQGQLVHSVFEEFFTRWQYSGRREIRAADLPEARALFAGVVDELLKRIPESEAGLERTRLLGSPAAAGLGEAVFRMEAERDTPVVERLLEYELAGEFTMTGSDGPRTVKLRGKVDRIDLLSDGTFRLIDYKLGWPPDRNRALQLPIYGLCAEERLRGRHGRSWTLGEAVYLAFKGPKRVVPLFPQNANRAEILDRAQQRLIAAIDAVTAGHFPPAPDDVFRCETCAFQAVCRKDYVGAV